MAQGGRRGNLGQSVVLFRILFYWEKFLRKVWLITCQKIINLRARERPKNRWYLYIIGFHKFTLSKL